MLNKWEIELKCKKGEFFMVAELKTDMSDVINTQVLELTKKICTLESEMILANLPEKDFLILKEQVRSESKKRFDSKSNYNEHNNKRAY